MKQSDNVIKVHPKYEPLFKLINNENKGIRYVLIEGGRASGKSSAVALFLAHCTYKQNYRILFTRYTMTSASDSIIPEFKKKVEWIQCENDFYYTANEAINKKTGVNILYRGLKPASLTANSALKSISDVNILVIEEAQECFDEELFNRVDESIRTKDVQNLIILTLNPQTVDHWIYKRFHKDKTSPDGRRDDTLYIKTDYRDNLKNLDETYIKNIEKIKVNNSLQYNNTYLGEWIEQRENALFNRSMIKKACEDLELTSYEKNGEYLRIVIAIDPAVTSNKNSDETGMVVCAEREGDRYIILEDYSGRYTPNEWGTKAVELYEKYNADCVVCEVNNGGDMVPQIIRNLDSSVNVKTVRATRGKVLRAEPIASLYSNDKVKHIQSFPKLEQQMINYTGEKHQSSPDRLDALVWGLTILSENKNANFDFFIV
jgi:PBSX family phage terminase large subunit